MCTMIKKIKENLSNANPNNNHMGFLGLLIFSTNSFVYSTISQIRYEKIFPKMDEIVDKIGYIQDKITCIQDKVTNLFEITPNSVINKTVDSLLLQSQNYIAESWDLISQLENYKSIAKDLNEKSDMAFVIGASAISLAMIGRIFYDKEERDIKYTDKGHAILENRFDDYFKK